jgi:hypothetical protein
VQADILLAGPSAQFTRKRNPAEISAIAAFIDVSLVDEIRRDTRAGAVAVAGRPMKGRFGLLTVESGG